MHEEPAAGIELGGRGEPGRVAAERADVLRLGAERQAAYRRVQPISPDDQAKPPRACFLEGDRDTFVVLVKPAGRVIEQVLGGRDGRLVENLAKIATQHLDFGDDPLAAEQLRRHPRRDLAVGTDEGDAALIDAHLPHPVHQSHPLDDRTSCPAQVDRLAPGARGRRTLHHGRGEAVLA